MSKSKGKCVSPRDIILRYGRDIPFRSLFFLLAPELDMEWSDRLKGAHRFLNRVWRTVTEVIR